MHGHMNVKILKLTQKIRVKIKIKKINIRINDDKTK
jgi:hypothetical protein